MLDGVLKWICAIAVAAFILGSIDAIDFHVCIKPAGQRSLR